MDDALAHQRGEPDRRPAIIGEHQERAGIGDDAAVQRHAVHGGRHAVLAHAVMDEAAGIIRRPTAPSCPSARVLLEPVRSAEPPIISGTAARQRFEREFRSRCASRSPSALRRASAFTARTAAASLLARQSPRMRRSNSARVRGVERREALAPRRAARRLPRAAGGAPGVADVGGNLERRRRSSRAFSRAPLDLVGAERRAVRLFGAGLGRRAEADGGAAGDQRRPVGRLARLRSRRRSLRDRGRRCGSPPSRRPRSASPDRPNRRATAARRSKCRCRRTARSAC